MADADTVTAPSQLYSSTPLFPKFVNVAAVTASAASYAVPAWSKFCLITSTVPFWGCITGTAVADSAVTNGTGSFYVPSGMQIRLQGGATLSHVRGGSASGYISIAHYV